MMKWLVLFFLVFGFNLASLSAQTDSSDEDIKDYQACIDFYTNAYGKCAASFGKLLDDDMASIFQKGALLATLDDFSTYVAEEEPEMVSKVEKTFDDFVLYLEEGHGLTCLEEKMDQLLLDCDYASGIAEKTQEDTEQDILAGLKDEPRYYLGALFWMYMME